MKSIREIAEQTYRKEHPRMFPHSPWERQMELSDLWPRDQDAYVKRVEQIVIEAIKSE